MIQQCLKGVVHVIEGTTGMDTNSKSILQKPIWKPTTVEGKLKYIHIHI